MRERGFDLAARLGERRARALYRDLKPADGVGERARFAPDPGAGLPVPDREEALVFASNNYLGLADDDRVIEAAAEAAEVVGVGAGASRLATGDTLVHRDLESRLADSMGTDRALAFSSGYAANVGTIAALEPDVIFTDELNHASIVDGVRLADAEVVTYDHCDPEDLRGRMRERAEASPTPAAANGGLPAGGAGESWLVVTESAFGADGSVAPLEALCDVAESVGAWLLVDEAHATGLYEGGGGVVQERGVGDRVQVQVGALSTALASQGGYVAGSETLVEYLANAARPFAFSTGLAPTAAAAASEALHLARTTERRERLWTNVKRLREGLEDVGYEVVGDSQFLPVVVGDRDAALALQEALRDRGIVALATRSPAVPEETGRIRVAPMATHTATDLEACIDAFAAAGEETGLL